MEKEQTVKEFLESKDLSEITPIFRTDISSMLIKESNCIVCGAPCKVLLGGLGTCRKGECFRIEWERSGERLKENIRLANLKSAKANGINQYVNVKYCIQAFHVINPTGEYFIGFPENKHRDQLQLRIIKESFQFKPLNFFP